MEDQSCSPRVYPLMEYCLELIRKERERQVTKWGDQTGNHPFEWVSILTEEVGEFADAVNETCIKPKYVQHSKPQRGGVEAMLQEAVHVAAVATAIAEAMVLLKKKEGTLNE